jgi:hypothetical protein
MGVIVTDSVAKDGPAITGSETRMVVVRVDAYDPTHDGRGTVVADVG